MSTNTSEAHNHLRIYLKRHDFAIDVELQLPPHGISVIFGQSGSGKTSILRCVAGLESTSRGFIHIQNEVWQDHAQSIFLPPWQRSVAYVFQEAQLFTHLNVQKNIEYGLRRRSKKSSTNIDDIVSLLGLNHLMKRNPQQLSGGERQRVAIARALATQPKLLLLDEPMASLDNNRRQEILPWLEKLRDELKTPMLYVSHSADEVARLADYIVCIDNGEIQSKGLATDILSAPNNPIMVGDEAGALLEASVIERDEQWQLSCVAFNGGCLWLRDSGLHLQQKVRIRVLAKDISITLNEPTLTSIQNHLSCVIESIHADQHPSQAIVRLQCGKAILLARITQRAVAQLQLQPKQAVWAQIKSVALVQ